MEQRPFHTLAGQVGPSWWRVGRNLAVLFAIFVHFDVIVDMLVAAVRRTFTGALGVMPDGVLLAGADMGIRRGPSETIEAYAERVRLAHTPIRNKGNPVVLLRQLRAYFAAWGFFQIEFINAFGYRISILADGSIQRDTVSADAEALAAGKFGRCRLFLRSANPLPITAADLKLVVTDWLAGHIVARVAAVRSTAHVWGEPGLAWGSAGLNWNVDEPLLVEVTE